MDPTFEQYLDYDMDQRLEHLYLNYTEQGNNHSLHSFLAHARSEEQTTFL